MKEQVVTVVKHYETPFPLRNPEMTLPKKQNNS